MNIGLDLDGVLFDSENLFMAYGVLYNKEIGGHILNPNSIRQETRYDWTDEQCQGFLNKYFEKVESSAPLMPCARDILTRLKKDGHKIFIITSRGHLSEKEIEITNKVLKREKLSFDGIYYSEYNKLNRCKQLNIDVMIDDYNVNILNLAKNGIKCLYYEDLVHNPIKHKNVKTIKNWGELYLAIKELALKKEA